VPVDLHTNLPTFGLPPSPATKYSNHIPGWQDNKRSETEPHQRVKGYAKTEKAEMTLGDEDDGADGDTESDIDDGQKKKRRLRRMRSKRKKRRTEKVSEDDGIEGDTESDMDDAWRNTRQLTSSSVSSQSGPNSPTLGAFLLPSIRNTSQIMIASAPSHSRPNSPKFGVFPLPSAEDISPIALRPKQRKQRLFNADRKAICIFHKENPSARQEDIADRYGIERSTVSKILRHKTKWLNVPEHETLRVAKHRYAKPTSQFSWFT
jgi:hypothetical protein